VLSELDVLVTPGLSIPAPRLDAATVRLDGEALPVGVALTHCTRIYNLTGLPAVSVPVGRTKAGLPVGIQIVGRHHDDWGVLQMAYAFQQATEMWKHRPAIAK